MPIDGKTKKNRKTPSSSKKSPKTIQESDSEEEREEGEVLSDDASNEECSSDDSVWSDSETSGEEDDRDAKAHSSALLNVKPVPSIAEAMRGAGKKPKVSSPLSPSSSSSAKKRKAGSSKEGDSKKSRSKKEKLDTEVSHPNIESEGKNDEDGKKKKKGEAPVFSDKNCDVDLFHSSPNNVIPQRIKVSNNMIVTCRSVEQNEQGRGLTYDFAAITFQRKTTASKMFEFMMPMNLAPRIIEALQIIVKENHKFFQPENQLK